MPDYFSVQMNIPDIPSVQVNQSASTSVANTPKTTENSFNSILQQALPKDTKDTLSDVASPTQGTASELTEPKGAARKTSTSIDQSLLPAGDINLKVNSTAEKAASLINQTLLPAGNIDLKVNSTAEKAASLINQTLLPSGDIDLKVKSTTEKAASLINQTLLPSGDIDLKVKSTAEKATSLINQTLLPSADIDLKTNGNAEKTASLIDQTLLPAGDIDLKTNGKAEKTGSLSDQSLLPAGNNDLKANVLQLFAYITNKINQETSKTTTPNDATSIDLDDNKLTELLNTYFESTPTKDIHQTLKDIRTVLSQVNATLVTPSQENPSLESPTTFSKQDELRFGALTKNLGELQNLLTGKAGSDVPIASHTPVNFSSQQQKLLERIQSFNTNGQEAGTLSIKNIQLPVQTLSLRNRLTQLPTQIQVIEVDNNSVTTSPLIKGDGFTALQEGLFAPTLRNRQQQLSGVRHDSTQQFYDAKTQAANVMGESSNLAENQKGDSLSQPGSGFNQMGSPAASPESTSTFSMTNSNSLNPLPGQVTDPTKTTMLPSGTIVHDQEVIQQLVQRFQVNRRQLDSKIQLKLHPVELGKMEIDLTVKEGSIRANVVAQSQHVQEILERNIAKLRSVLERQGFNVEDITVTSGSETVGEFDLFEQQLPHRDTSNSLAKNDKSETHTPFSIDDTEESGNEINSGVNVKA